MCDWTVKGSRYGYDRHRRLGLLPACDDCKIQASAWQAEYRKSAPSANATTRRWSHYRMREQDYRALLAAQNYACKICEIPFEDLRQNKSPVYVDHDHNCNHEGKGNRSCVDCVRGLLCPGCNHFLVILEDTERLKKSLDYLHNEHSAEIIRQSRLW